MSYRPPLGNLCSSLTMCPGENKHVAYSKTFVKQTLSKRTKIRFQDQLLLNTGQKYSRMLQGEHSAILLTFIKLLFVIKMFVLSIFEWPFYTGSTLFHRIIDFSI